MPFCSKCGKEVSEEQGFCPNCGVNLKPEGFPSEAARMRRVERREKAEKAEKAEKTEKEEKEEKHEKEEISPVAPLVGGMILVFIGIVSFLTSAGIVSLREMWPYLLLFLGLVIVVAAIYAGMIAYKRSPRP